jgi:hypothetical protein
MKTKLHIIVNGVTHIFASIGAKPTTKSTPVLVNTPLNSPTHLEATSITIISNNT